MVVWNVAVKLGLTSPANTIDIAIESDHRSVEACCQSADPYGEQCVLSGLGWSKQPHVQLKHACRYALGCELGAFIRHHFCQHVNGRIVVYVICGHSICVNRGTEEDASYHDFVGYFLPVLRLVVFSHDEEDLAEGVCNNHPE